MSWQAYVDTSLVASGHVDQGAIISAAGDSVWAASPGFTLSVEEMKAIAGIVSENATAVKNAYENGVHAVKKRFIATRIDGRTLHTRQGQEGFCAAKTKQAIVIGHYNKDQQVGNCSKTVEGLADYLIEQGY
ncbi:hypothetical protein BROUX41_005430 [Berkeleyomyces rouxiae]|uniref:uncharacterized protein n=1 Tax=Berkeleyomyces rouxiae TaxID=2035830 RepID=UPI003B7AFD75